MKVLIFGGSGFLGKNLCEKLLLMHYDVTVFGRKDSEQMILLRDKLPQLSFIWGDFSMVKNFSDIVKDFDFVFHLISATGPSNSNPKIDLTKVIQPTILLLEACVKNKIKKFVFYSSGGTVYGIPKIIPICENHPTSPISAYGIHKIVLEKYIEYYFHMYGLNYSILRIANPYGIGQHAFSSQGLIANVMAKALLHTPIEIWGDGSAVRDYLYVDDVSNAALKTLNYSGEFHVFNIGSGIGFSVNEIVDIIEEIIKQPIQRIYKQARKQDVPTNILDITKAKRFLNWEPSISIYQGIELLYNHWSILNKKNNRICIGD